MRSRVFGVAGTLALFVVRLAGADAPGATTPGATQARGGAASSENRPAALGPARADCEHQASTVSGAACELARTLSAQIGDAIVASAPPKSEAALRDPESLSRSIAELTAAALGNGTRAIAPALLLAQAMDRARGARMLIYLTPTLQRDKLEVVADAYTLRARFWARVRSPRPERTAHALVSRPLDSELRALFPRIPLVVTRVDKAPLPEREAAALACGDADGDGSNEIAFIGRRAVSLGRLAHGRFNAIARVPWTELSAIAASPLREPIGSAEILEPGVLIAGLSDRADAIRFAGALGVTARWHGFMPWPGGACSVRSPLGIQGKPLACPGSAAVSGTEFAGELDALAGAVLSGPSGKPRRVRIARALGADHAHGYDDRNQSIEIPDSGAALAVGDLDRDGDPEIVTTSPSLERASDELVVRTWNRDGSLVERFRMKVPSGIQALAVCPAEGPGMAPLVAATGDSIWVIR